MFPKFNLNLPLVQSAKLLVFVDHLEKLSIRRAELQAAAMPLLKSKAERPASSEALIN
jgi:hypothetical protein